jgi:hypothetical protein
MFFKEIKELYVPLFIISKNMTPFTNFILTWYNFRKQW